jgi:hypothetical protein
MYIMIHESGDMVLLKELTKDDLRAADDGYVDLLDVSRADAPLRYVDEGWTDVDAPNDVIQGPRSGPAGM